MRTDQPQLDGLFDALGIGIVALDETGTVLEVNRAMTTLTGFSEEELVGSPASRFMAGALLASLASSETSHEHAIAGQYKHSSGANIPVSVSATPLLDANEKPRRIVLCVADKPEVSDQVQTLQERIRDFARASADWFWETGADDRFVFISDTFLEKLGLEPGIVMGHRQRDIAGEEQIASDPDKWNRHFADLEAHRPFRDLCYDVKDGTGHLHIVKISGIPIFDATGQFSGYRGSGTDVTETREAEHALRQAAADLRESKHRLTSMMNAVPHAVITIDMQGIIHTFNPAAERIFGYSVAQAVGQNVGILMPDNVRTQHDGFIRKFLETGSSTAIGKRREVVGQRENGEQFPLEIAVNWMEVPDGVMFVGVCQDITAQKDAERERAALEQDLLQSHKMESLGTLAGGIAHEINTPMQYVGDNICFLKDAFTGLGTVLLKYAELQAAVTKGVALPEAVAEIASALKAADLAYLCEEIPTAISQSLDGVHRISEIVQAIKEFSHPGSKEKSPTKINQAIQTTLTVARNQWKYVAEVTTDFDEEMPEVPCVPGEFNQVILNLIVNAAHAIEAKGGNGHITISTKRCDDWAEIRISDDGTGIPEELREKIFEPFFTTKEPGKGTGQGLAISRTIITKSHHGTIAVESAVGKGTTFVIRIPLAKLEPLDMAS